MSRTHSRLLASPCTALESLMSSPTNITPHTLDESRQLELLRQHRKAHRQKLALQPPQANDPMASPPQATRGQRLADKVAATLGSWRFIMVQSTAIVFWITGNVLTDSKSWDPYPFIFLNLLLSFQAA